MPDIETSEARHDEIMEQFAELGDDCAENLWRHLRWFSEGMEPDEDELCGWMGDVYAVFAAKIPGCKGMCLISVAMDGTMMWHGLSKGIRPCAEARLFCARDRQPASTRWEPRK